MRNSASNVSRKVSVSKLSSRTQRHVSDFNTARGQLGVSTFLSFSNKGERGYKGAIRLSRPDIANRFSGNSVAVAYLPPSVLKRPNLTVAVTTTVEKVLFDESGSEPRAIGVEVSKSPVSPKYCVRANREVILCGGTVATPHILLVSGIGPREELSKVGIKVVKDLSQVGKNYCDVGVVPITDISLCVLTTVHSISTLVPSAFAASADTRSISSIRQVKGFLRCYDGWSFARVR